MSNNKSENKSKSVPQVRVRTGVKAGPGGYGTGGVLINHGIRIRTRVKAGGPLIQHGVRVRRASR
jgi:hypothetical protein